MALRLFRCPRLDDRNFSGIVFLFQEKRLFLRKQSSVIFCSYLMVSIDHRPTGRYSAFTMCGRFTATLEFSDIRARWNLDRVPPSYTPRFNVAPETSPTVSVIVRHRGGNECRLIAGRRPVFRQSAIV